MFGLTVPAIAAAAVAAVLAVGAASVPEQALADEGGGGAGTTAGSPARTPAASASAGAASGAAAGVSASTPAGVPGAAAGPGAMDVSPAAVAPGGVVTLRLETSCTAGHKAKASAEVFVDSVTLAPAGDGHGLEGSAFIRSDAAEGSYAISVDCDGTTSAAQASVTVTGAGAGVPLTPETPLRPLKPVPAGGGGTARLAAGPAAAGTGTGAFLVTGGFAAAGLAGLVIHRRRSGARDGARG